MTMLHVQSIAVSGAVVCFFAIGIIGSISGLAPGACCKRALLGAIVAYVATRVASRAINAILVQAIIDHQMKKERSGDGEG
jgi:hypothetical protein